MKNKSIFILVNSGILNTTANDASDSAAYEHYKLRKQLTSAYEDLINRRNDLLKENPGEGDEASDRAKDLIEQLFEDETEIKVNPISYQDWRAIQKENADKKVFVGFNEEFLEGVFWKVPED